MTPAEERAFIARLESANAEELILILSRPGPDEDRVLRLHLGAERYERLRRSALRSLTRSTRSAEKKGNVVILHGIMGSELQRFEANRGRPVWLSLPRLIMGATKWLEMNNDGQSVYDVRATGLLKRWYSELMVGLAFDWNVQTFPFDWRRDLAESAGALNDRINEWFGSDTPVHLVAHSMGGLVSRTFILNYPERWERAWDSKGKGGVAGGRLIMLGTPNHGSFAIPQIITGIQTAVKMIMIADLEHRSGVLRIINTFPGSYQMLPSPLVLPEMQKLYRSETYGEFSVPQSFLDKALSSHQALAGVVDPKRMTYVAGYNRRTSENITNLSDLGSMDAYSFSLNGDGTVPHVLGFLKKGDEKVPTYFADAAHGALPNHESVIGAVPELLETGSCSLPSTNPGAARALVPDAVDELAERAQVERDQIRLKQIVQTTRARTRGAADDPDSAPVSEEEKEAEEIILESFVADAESRTTSGKSLPSSPSEFPPPRGDAKDEQTKGSRGAPPSPSATIKIALVKGGIDSVEASPNGKAIDAIAVGHYFGVRPQAAERALDEAISAAYLKESKGRQTPASGSETVPESELLLTLLTERGHIPGSLGEPFILPDPRKEGRIVVLAGMGTPGHFGVPELTVLAQELCWSLGRLGKTHLATVLIGAGTGNLPVKDAVDGWLRGISRALLNSPADAGRGICQITFVEYNARTFNKLNKALQAVEKDPPGALQIEYERPSDEVIAKARDEAVATACAEVKKEFDPAVGAREADELVPVRLTIDRQRKGYGFAALTQSAAIPQRDIALDPRLVESANDELAGAAAEAQTEAGRFLEKLLLPEDIRSQIYTRAPIVLILDSSSARVHWEMVARTAPWDRRETAESGSVDLEKFLGTTYGLTRQLRTTFAPAPEPPPPPKREIKALIVADPALDAPLQGAQAEGEEIASLLERFKSDDPMGPSRILVTRLFGPAQAKRTTVLKKLMLEDFDIFHFAGHCIYDKSDPSNSGWVFSARDDERLTANELNRIDRIPKFIFSNACESGITPDRASERSADLAPSFAESFFARGVANFICTGWPVNDTAARTFATTLYAKMFGLDGDFRPAYLHEAMRAARVAIARQPEGTRTWGAYQHYGNPYFRFFNPPHSEPGDGPKKEPLSPGARPVESGPPKAKTRRESKTAGRRPAKSKQTRRRKH
ncbi:MAG TPA: CHAT domain-containing protein [Chthoniobacterales bacterium]|nr:CHAT domain-containing protein [Chthoniobacterales bacterium]